MNNCYCDECENRGSCTSYGAGKRDELKRITEVIKSIPEDELWQGGAIIAAIEKVDRV